MVTGIVMLFWSLEDIRYRSIRVWHLMMGGILLWLLGAVDGSLLTQGRIDGLLPGIFLLCMAGISHGALGAADGIILLVLGGIYGVWEVMMLLFCGLCLFCLLVALLLMIHRIDRSARLPFVPFLLGGYLVSLCQFPVLIR